MSNHYHRQVTEIVKEFEKEQIPLSFPDPIEKSDAPKTALPVLPPQGDVYQLQQMRDFQRANDPMIPPIQRGYFPPTMNFQLPFNVPTQHGYGPFQLVGYVFSKHDGHEMFRLMGRQLNSNRWEYYVIHPYTEIKMPIKVKNDWELHTDDRVEIPGFNGHYRVQIYDYDWPRYVPY